ncbi:MAG: adenine phosphoribosyltransferase [Cyanobacteria bacterium J06639_1]
MTDLKALIRSVPDFPKPGIVFRDITTLLCDPQGLQAVVHQFRDAFAEQGIDYVVGTESRGFIFGSPLAYCLGAGFVPVRKPGKLPAATYQAEYELEYGSDRLEIHQDAFVKGNRVAIVDDLIATGGTAAATAELVEQAGATVCGFGFLIELTFLEGRKVLPEDIPVHSLIAYDTE